MTTDDGVLLTLPDELRAAFKDPLGPVYTDTNRLDTELGKSVIAVGDVVTRHLAQIGTRPDLAVIDWITERETLPEADQPDLDGYDAQIEVENPAATLTENLLNALRMGVEQDEKTVIVVDGEEDLATLPALVVAPDGASVVYGQPGEGMVHVRIDSETKEQGYELLSRMDGDDEEAYRVLGNT